MTLSPDEARDALRDISKTEQRSANAYGYSIAAPHFFLWGAIWLVGYGAVYLHREWAAAWPILSLAGVAGSFTIGWLSKSATSRSMDWRSAGTILAVFAFLSALFAVMPPRNDLQIAAFFPILVAFFYLIVGIWTRGVRMIVAGVVIGALTLIGFFYLPAYFMLWMAIVGGGGLILGGFWLRSL